MTEDVAPVGVDPDGPGDLFYPFSNLRLATVSPEFRITRELLDSIATTAEDPTLNAHAKAAVWVGACLGAIGQLETELLTLRRERDSGQS